ncbi:MAG: hypothetical protein Q8R34_00700 [bacterium]|nr:hypothetical protein [bacterium]
MTRFLHQADKNSVPLQESDPILCYRLDFRNLRLFALLGHILKKVSGASLTFLRYEFKEAAELRLS